MIRTLLCAAALAAPSVALAQTPVTITPASNSNVLRAGERIPVRTLVDMTTKKKALKVGDRVNVETAENVMVGSNIVIPAGTPGVAEITSVRNKGMWGKSGFIEGRVLYIRMNGRQIRMTGTFNDKGVTGTAGVVGAIALVPIAGFFTTGTSASIPLGSIIPAFLDEDIAFTVAEPAPLPTVVATQATTSTLPAPTPAAATANPMIDPSLHIQAN